MRELLLDRIYDEHGPAVLRLATRLCGGDRHRAEDVLQGTVVRAWHNAAGPRLTALAVGEAARTLSTEHQRVLVAMYCLDGPHTEAAAAAGVPPGTVKSRVFHALRALRRALGEPAAAGPAWSIVIATHLCVLDTRRRRRPVLAQISSTLACYVF